MTVADLGSALNGRSLIGFDTTGPNVVRLASPKVGIISICFAPGTLIRTDDGQQPVELLRIGDKVATFDGLEQPIVWLGKQALKRADFKHRESLPVCFRAGSLADGVPARDLTVSTGHCMFIDGRLVQAGHLVNDASIVRVEPTAIDLYHVELDHHSILFAEGAPAETYLDVGNRGLMKSLDHSANWPRAIGDADTQKAAPQIDRGPELVAIRERLEARLPALGFVTTTEPDLFVEVSGRRVACTAVGAGVYRFALGITPQNVRIGSRSGIPMETRTESRDGRRLGVGLDRIALSGPSWSVEVHLSHPALRSGFHPEEEGFRWTDGNAALPVSAIVTSSDPVTLELSVKHNGWYRVGGADPATTPAQVAERASRAA